MLLYWMIVATLVLDLGVQEVVHDLFLNRGQGLDQGQGQGRGCLDDGIGQDPELRIDTLTGIGPEAEAMDGDHLLCTTTAAPAAGVLSAAVPPVLVSTNTVAYPGAKNLTAWLTTATCEQATSTATPWANQVHYRMTWPRTLFNAFARRISLGLEIRAGSQWVLYKGLNKTDQIPDEGMSMVYLEEYDIGQRIQQKTVC
eukprot:TRINITY_DN4223_c0_g2_i2.p2 TRINITY_DN4223_c0_g2~~TRINITY_DN4223_c0_g2_i2.p2  ORF type:complete len:206 (-),score=6.07 TRINITY_DN4223_c0_g2_i2:262-858(-)